ncbi:MAG: hypothetical protein SF182_00265 [Deltaproteobacteria bacterium]|nr:hypothetical protein [Deltaproteobacteria bacterium]
MRKWASGLVTAVVLWSGAEAAAACVGDCTGKGAVDVADLVRGVNIALGNAAIESCSAFDGDADGGVSIAELIVAVGNALGGCDGGSPTATPLPATPSPTATAAAGGPCGDTSSVAGLFESRRGRPIQLYATGGMGGLYEQHADPGGVSLLFVTLGENRNLNLRIGGSTTVILPFRAQDQFDDLPHELNVLYNPDPAQPLVGWVGALQCDKATGDWFLQVAAANDRFGNFVTFSSDRP